MRNYTLRSMLLAALLAALTAVVAQYRFFLPGLPTVPVTLQVLAVLLAGGLLGPVWGFAALGLYVLLGAVGLPVFAGFNSGLGVLLGPTGGYLWSYPFAALAVGLIAPPHRRPGMSLTVSGMLLGLLIIYAGGAGWAILLGGKAVADVMKVWVLPFVPFDLVKLVIAATVSMGVNRALAAQSYWRKAA